MEKVCVVGLGTVGMPTAAYIRKRGFRVYGYDVKPKFSKNLTTTVNWQEVPSDVQVYVITVATSWKENKPNTSNVWNVCQMISKKNAQALVCIESTVPVGTCRGIAKECALNFLVYVPHRYWTGNTTEHGVRQIRVIGAINDASLRKGLRFYRQLDITLHIAPSIEVVELCKIAENAYRFVQIAYAEELRMICESNDVSFEEVRRACNTKWNIEILEAKDGIKGSCLPKDTRYLKQLMDLSYILDGAVATDELYQKFWRAHHGSEDDNNHTCS